MKKLVKNELFKFIEIIYQFLHRFIFKMKFTFKLVTEHK